MLGCQVVVSLKRSRKHGYSEFKHFGFLGRQILQYRQEFGQPSGEFNLSLESHAGFVRTENSASEQFQRHFTPCAQLHGPPDRTHPVFAEFTGLMDSPGHCASGLKEAGAFSFPATSCIRI